jgi:hypothetical protein
VEVLGDSGGRTTVHAGNGPLGLIATVAAMERRMKGLCGEELRRALDVLVTPYPKGRSLTTYVYFVERGRFYRNGRVWRRLLIVLEKALDDYASGFERDTSTFDEDPNTLLIVLREGQEVVCSLHVRCSGTEAKIGLKASAADRPVFAALFQAFDDEVFFLLAEELRDSTSIYWQRQKQVLGSLLLSNKSWRALEAELGAAGQSNALIESQNRFLASALAKQRLLVKKANDWSLTNRGQRYAKALCDWT